MLGSLFLHFLGCLPKEEIGRNRGSENCHQNRQESARPLHARQERHRQRLPPIDVSEKRSQHVGEQNERHPLENPRHQLVRTPEQKRQDAQRIHRNPDVRLHAGDKLRGLRHAAEIRADVDDVGDNQNRAGAPQHPTRIIIPHRGSQPAPGDHREPRAHQLDRHHQRKRQQRDPQRGVAVGCSGDGIGGDSRRIIVGCSGDQSGAQDREEFLRGPGYVSFFDIRSGQMFSRHEILRTRYFASR